MLNLLSCVYIIGNSICLLGAYAPSTRKTCFEISKNLTKIFAFKYSQSKCACNVSSKTDMFCGLCKKQKVSCGMPYF
jgi:hypothetical protein